MQQFFHQTRDLCLVIFVVGVFAGCDQIAKVYSGIGDQKNTSSETNPSTAASDSIEDAQSAAADDSSAAAEDDGSTEPDPEVAGSADDPGNEDNEDETSGDAADRNVDQYPRLPRNVTWKPISASSGGNLTIVLWGRGGGEKNYEKGSLRVEHNDGVKYPRTYVRRDDPDNGERAPKFYFDVQGGWFAGKDPVLFWNLGAYRVVHPEKRQGKNEDKE